MKDHLARMLDSLAWAERRTLAAVRDVPSCQAEALPIVAHMLAAGHVWLARVEGRPSRLAVWPALTLDECAALAAENAAGYADLMTRLDDGRLARVITYRNGRGEEAALPIGDILTHVVIHGSYHRGQVARLIGQAGGSAPLTDYFAFVQG